MSLAIPLREDFDAMTLRRLARHSKDAAQTRRFLALAAIYDVLRPRCACYISPDRSHASTDHVLGVALFPQPPKKAAQVSLSCSEGTPGPDALGRARNLL